MKVMTVSRRYVIGLLGNIKTETRPRCGGLGRHRRPGASWRGLRQANYQDRVPVPGAGLGTAKPDLVFLSRGLEAGNNKRSDRGG